MFRERDVASDAEIVWVLETIASSLPASSSHRTMIPGAVPEGFLLNAKKMTYLLTEAIYPYFREIFVENIQMSDFVLEYDETTNNAGVKDLQTKVRYWLKEQK